MQELPGASRDLLESLDGLSGLRNDLRRIGDGLGYWAGIPMPLDGESLVVEPTYPHADELMAMCGEKPADDAKESDISRLRNTFWSTHLRADVLMIELKNGRMTYGIDSGVHNLDLALRTLGCAEAWGVEQEVNAVHALGDLVSHRQFKQYMLVGAFLESSKRSGVTYMFRRLRPTVAMGTRSGRVRLLCMLCLHPIAYYSHSWAGAMCPTDDVIAHLMLMRGDEPMLWRRSNQHAAHRPGAGL